MSRERTRASTARRRVVPAVPAVLGAGMLLISVALAAQPPQPVQNYFLEAILGGIYHHTPFGSYREFRGDGLLTRGTRCYSVGTSFGLASAIRRVKPRSSALGVQVTSTRLSAGT